MLVHSRVPMSYWPFVFQSVVHIINRLPTFVFNFKSPFEIIFQKFLIATPSKFLVLYVFLIFDRIALISCKYDQLSVFLGNSSQHKGFLCLDVSTSRIYVSRHVVFKELDFPLKKTSVHIFLFCYLLSYFYYFFCFFFSFYH